MQKEIITLSDNRKISYVDCGDKDNTPLFYAHGGPGSHLEAKIFLDEALKRNYRLIATDRPGMSDSDYLPNRKLTDYPKDIAEIADKLGIEKFGVFGWSGGGAHTTVCAYVIPERLLFNVTYAGYTNFGELENAASYLESKMDQISVGLSKKLPFIFKFFFDLMRWGAYKYPDSTIKEFQKTMSKVDADLLFDPDFKEAFLNTQREAFKQGSKGVATDAAVHYVDWGFKLKDITFPIHVIHGTDDKLVPFKFGEHLAENIPSCTFHKKANEGHLLPGKNPAEIFDIIDLARSKSL